MATQCGYISLQGTQCARHPADSASLCFNHRNAKPTAPCARSGCSRRTRSARGYCTRCWDNCRPRLLAQMRNKEITLDRSVAELLA